MRTTQAVPSIRGVDTYFIPPFWTDVKDVYLVPVEVVQMERKRPLSSLLKYKVSFVVLPPDKENKSNPVQRRLKLRAAPEKDYVIVADIEMRENN